MLLKNSILFVKTEKEKLSFKSQIILIDKQEIILELPTKAVAKENRLEQRISFDLSSSPSIVLTNPHQNKFYQAKLLNFGKNGMGIFIESKIENLEDFPKEITLQQVRPYKNIEGLLINEKLSIKYLQKISFSLPENKIKYQGTKIGVNFSSSKNLYEKLNQLIKNK